MGASYPRTRGQPGAGPSPRRPHWLTAQIDSAAEIVSRAEWGARPPCREPELGTIELVVVHHTALGRRDRPGGDPAAALRAIQDLHMDANGWDDIAYHLLVDRSGVVYEGRAGGVGHPVVGAHTHGYNRRSAGIALIGDFAVERPSPAALTGLATAIALELGPPGLRADAKTVRGHGELAATECPGAALSACLPDVRRRAAELLA